MSTAPKVSIVIPTYNQASFLRDALELVVAQTYTDWEAIVVNNFSDDDTVDVVRRFGDPRIRLENFANNGVIAASRNKGIERARGEWIAFLDSDDLWRPEKLEKCLIPENMRFDVISHRERTFREARTVSISPRYRPEDAAYRNLLLKGNRLSPSAVIVRKGAVSDVGGFSEASEFTTAEDYDLWLKLTEAGATVVFVDEVLSDYRLHEANASGAVLRHMDAGLSVLTAHFERMSRKSWVDRLRYRKRRAMVIYGAGRNFQRAGRKAEAIKYYAKSLSTFPFYLRAFVCILIALLEVRQRSAKPVG